MRASSRSTLSLSRLAWFGIAVGMATFLTLLRTGGPTAAHMAISSRFAANGQLQRARNPVQLTVLKDAAKVVGWVSGVRDHAGEAVSVQMGNKIEKIKLERGNTFTWPYKVEKATQVQFLFGRSQQTITLHPPSALPPCVFFVVDRGVYRPRQTLRFAGFLRALDDRGEFVPLPGRSVEVVLASEQKKSVVTRLKVTSDEEGRIIGAYTFVDNDSLDHYRLSIPGYRGSAPVTLAEYRKSKTYLSISGHPEGARLNLRFQARDYLDKPLPGVDVQLVAQVVREPHRRRTAALDGKQFAYADENQPPALLLEDLSAEEQALAEGEEGFQPIEGLAAGRERQVVTELKGRVQLDLQGEGTYPIELEKAWQQPGYAVVVQGVMIDPHGREERCTRTLPLAPLHDDLRLTLSRPSYEVNERIAVTMSTTDSADLKGTASLVAMRLIVTPPRGGKGVQPGLGNYPGYCAVPVSNWNSIRRTAVNAVAFKGDTATLRLPEPGAYVLIARVHRPDGSLWRQEIGCVVRPQSELPALSLYLDRDTYQSGDTLNGVIQSKFADACVLATLRDSVGLRVWKTLRLTDGIAKLKLELPADCRYGCTIEVQYADVSRTLEAAHVASRGIHVVPIDRMLAIHSSVKPVCEPGEKAVINLEVNRKEPVDLIVSVYDKALLGIAADRSPDVRNFYLADERVSPSDAREMLRQRLGGMSVSTWVQRARSWFREHPEKTGTAEAAIARLVVGSLGKQPLSTSDVAQLLRMVGIKTRVLADSHTWKLPTGNHLREVSVAEWLDTAEDKGWRLHYSLLGDTLFLTSYHPVQDRKPWSHNGTAFIYYGMLPVVNGGFGSNFHGAVNLGVGGGVIGFGGGLRGGIGGIAGLGGGGFNQLGAIGGFGGMGMMGMGGFQGGASHLPAMPSGGFNASPSHLVQAPEAKNVQPIALLDGDTDQPDLQVRRDFSDSAYWNACVRTDAEGKAKVEFQLPDSLTGWRVVVTAVTRDLHVGRHETSFQTARSIMVNPILPRFFTEGDRVQVSAVVHNRTRTRQSIQVRLKVENGKVMTPTEREVTLEPEGSASVSWTFQAGDAGFTQLLMSARCPAGSDASLKRLPVLRVSVEHVVPCSGFCKNAAEFSVPAGVDLQKAVVEMRFAPTLTADLIDTLDYLVDYPYGCVEQTMSRFLPAIKVAQILKHFEIDHPSLTRRLPTCVSAGIKRLLELQQPDGGWGWNGTGQTHEMMTPYALYGLLQAEKAGYPLGSETSVERGLERLRRFIGQMGINQSSDRIFCMYVYGHRHDVPADWWQFIEAQRAKGKLTDYALALALDLAMQQKQAALAQRLATDLRGRSVKLNDLVHWRTAGFSRWGDDPFEITAMALKALVAYDKEDSLIPGVLAYFVANKRGNHWNSTKDTAMIVFALCDYLARQEHNLRSRPHVAFRCNDGPIHEVPFTGSSESRSMVVPVAEVKAGRNPITFAEGSPGMMYRLVLRYQVPDRSAAPESQGIRVARRFWLLDAQGKRTRELHSGDSAPRGAYLETVVEATPVDGGDMRFVLVENPRPACCEVVPAIDRRFDQQGTPCVLREDRETLIAYHHEQTSGKILDRCVLHAELAGDYLVPAAQVEMMYRTEIRGHSGTFSLRIADN